MSTKQLAVVVPAHNEAKSIGDSVRYLRELDGELRDLGLELIVIVVDDGSTDDTATLARAAGADKLVSLGTRHGLGAAVRAGFIEARAGGADIVVKIDGDGQHDPRDIPTLIAPILKNDADVVYGSRLERIGYRMPMIRRAGNTTFSWLMRALTGWAIEDSQPGILAVNKTYLCNFELPGDYNYTQQLLLDAYFNGMRFGQVPVAFQRRTEGTSFVSLRYPFIVVYQILLLLISVRPMKIFAPIGGALIFFATIVFGVEILIWMFGDAGRPIRHVNLVLGSFLFGLQTLFFGLLAQLIVNLRATLRTTNDRGDGGDRQDGDQDQHDHDA